MPQGPTNIPSDSNLVAQQINEALFFQTAKQSSFVNRLTGPMPKGASQKIKRGEQVQTSPSMPIVLISDLGKSAGDNVQVDMMHDLSGKPDMGDANLEGRAEGISMDSMNVFINLGSKSVDTGGVMAQQRTPHDLKNGGRSNLVKWWNKWNSQRAVVHLAGARGDAGVGTDDNQWMVPNDTDPKFAEYLVNPVQAPTYGRHFYGGDASAIDNIDAADLLTFDRIEDLRVQMDEATNPLPPVIVEGDPQAEENPPILMYVSSRQYRDLKRSNERLWNTALQNAHKRADGFNHPLFRGDCVVWENIIVRKLPWYVRFNAGSNVTVAQDTAGFATEIKVPGVNVDRAIILGGQALAHAYGKITNLKHGGKAGHHFHVFDEPVNKGTRLEVTLQYMDGYRKFRWEDANGRVYDFGCAVMDTATS